MAAPCLLLSTASQPHSACGPWIEKEKKDSLSSDVGPGEWLVSAVSAKLDVNHAKALLDYMQSQNSVCGGSWEDSRFF